MSAKYAVLGLVIERPGYGYQLAQRLEERFGCSEFAPSGVYSALDQLSRDSLIRSAGEMERFAVAYHPYGPVGEAMHLDFPALTFLYAEIMASSDGPPTAQTLPASR